MNTKSFDYDNYLMNKQGNDNRHLMPYDKREPWERLRDAHTEEILEFVDEHGIRGTIEAKAYEILKKHNHPFIAKIKLL